MRFLILPSALAAVLLAATQSAHAQAGDKPVCLRAPSGGLSCLYDSGPTNKVKDLEPKLARG